ncbi:hypothetical protein [Natronincola ferrireducens]|uniref:Uncharacterized protein n=1 Tax=Natronincola ferrireducens TaxID=393762 RepID=A0A1G9GXQ2_9FIRM|nr:hypothetical protein [Natronincola ferrireducens]SDL05451.1 hypothetical protein SAMN05660472_02521 [Natronincola ferrireducens]
MNNRRTFFISSTIIAIMTTLILPSSPGESTAILRYQYGFPINYITFFQTEPSSRWFGANFFTGNAGLSIDPAILLINILIIYFVIKFVAKIYSKSFYLLFSVSKK